MLPFRSRFEAAPQVVLAPDRFHGTYPVIGANPRGTMSMDKVVADPLGCELDTVHVKKIGAPDCPEITHQGAAHLFVVPGALEHVASPAADRFARWLMAPSARRTTSR
ncbi:hypothetical protein [Lysobacter sp. Root983]|uniref:hypothetical protein n=1 Tax=Lysobacter sp. Root983 TaxID=1736613 RepID=UPI0012F970DB|nr:hypothetical protein [Lysobacter sp. Root983]